MSTIESNLYSIVGRDRSNAVSNPSVSTRKYAIDNISREDIHTIVDSKSQIHGQQIIKTDFTFYLLLITNILIAVLALITYITHTSKLKEECKTPIYINILSGILYGSLIYLTYRQWTTMRRRIHSARI